eukprot:696529-Rhodomonas_salina.2
MADAGAGGAGDAHLLVSPRHSNAQLQVRTTRSSPEPWYKQYGGRAHLLLIPPRPTAVRIHSSLACFRALLRSQDGTASDTLALPRCLQST